MRIKWCSRLVKCSIKIASIQLQELECSGESGAFNFSCYGAYLKYHEPNSSILFMLKLEKWISSRVYSLKRLRALRVYYIILEHGNFIIGLMLFSDIEA